MTSTGNATKTWTRKNLTENAHLDDSYYGSHRGGRSFHYNNRDAKGRFVKAVHIDQIDAENLPCWNAGGLGHAVESCAHASGEAVQVHHKDAKFFCGACVFVPNCEPSVSRATKKGECECPMCEQVLPVTKFPTVKVAGDEVTRGTTCRACQAEAREARKARTPWRVR